MEITGNFEKMLDEQKKNPAKVESPEIAVKRLRGQLDKLNHDLETVKMQYNEAKYHPYRNVIKQIFRKIL